MLPIEELRLYQEIIHKYNLNDVVDSNMTEQFELQRRKFDQDLRSVSLGSQSFAQTNTLKQLEQVINNQYGSRRKHSVSSAE